MKQSLSFVRHFLFYASVLVSGVTAQAQIPGRQMHWSSDGNAYITSTQEGLVLMDIRTGRKTVIVAGEKMRLPDSNRPIVLADYAFTSDSSAVLVYTNTARVWRYNTRGDYYLVNRQSGNTRQVGKGRPAQSLMYAKLSPNGRMVAYVSDHNLYVEDVATGKTTQLTSDGTRKRINGTFDWVYEEEFDCRDGFRWSPNSQQIAYWQVDATKIRDYLMLNTTDSAYSHVVPVEYPKVGVSPSPTRIGIVSVTGGATKWLNIPGDSQQHYLVRMEWLPGGGNVITQQLNRKQNESKIFICSATGQSVTPIYTETDKTWIDAGERWTNGTATDWGWLNKGNAFGWVSQKDGWRHLYRLSTDGKTQTLLTPGEYDIESVTQLDERNNRVYFIASPQKTNQRYLYQAPLNGQGRVERVTPTGLDGTHEYTISPNGQWAQHTFTSYQTPSVQEWISLPDHKAVNNQESIAARLRLVSRPNVNFFTVKTEDGVSIDGWMVKPTDFDSTKKYPIVFYVYGEPASCTVNDDFSVGRNFLFQGDMAKAGYLYVALDNRGTPNLKGAQWRKSIYRQVGRLNIRDQAQAAQKLFAQHAFIDTSRVAVWGWSGGGSTTLHLLFQYPQIYKTGIAIAAVGNQLFYDNIYQERYMGLPQENVADFVAGSPITYAKNLKGNLLYIHGTGDDNVHYDNAELLINELVKYNKQFQFMPYPNRSHGIYEGEGTRQHLQTLYTTYLLNHCPPGPR